MELVVLGVTLIVPAAMVQDRAIAIHVNMEQLAGMEISVLRVMVIVQPVMVLEVINVDNVPLDIIIFLGQQNAS